MHSSLATVDWDRLDSGKSGSKPSLIDKGDHTRVVRSRRSQEHRRRANTASILGATAALDHSLRMRMRVYERVLDSVGNGRLSDPDGASQIMAAWEEDSTEMLSGGGLCLTAVDCNLAELERDGVISLNERRQLEEMALSYRVDAENLRDNVWQQTVDTLSASEDSTESPGEDQKSSGDAMGDEYLRMVSSDSQNHPVATVLFSRYFQEKAKATLLRNLKSYPSVMKHDIANDVVQAFTLKIMEKLVEPNEINFPEDRMRIEAYLLRGVYHQLVQYIRSKRSHSEVIDDIMASPDSDLNGTLYRSESQWALSQAMHDYLIGNSTTAEGHSFGHSTTMRQKILDVIPTVVLGKVSKKTSVQIAMEIASNPDAQWFRDTYSEAIKLVLRMKKGDLPDGVTISPAISKTDIAKLPKGLREGATQLRKMNNLIDQYYKRGLVILRREVGVDEA
ncbi:hypothetical protein HN709_03690 [Candidatus Peregrinibacteria bacterium]|jgi:hypothetical protein|nr:hypothetical protein [Candidatus Peregrinibacteria bacterium]MBT7736768.1 hypothetical protein [Candidatus Peregrinibacteria bacterium]